MTSKTDAAGHPEVTEIADLTEGLLPPSRSSDVRRHLDDCEVCADVHASLKEIRGLLGTLPEPPRIPADIAGRIDAALAAEALLRATAPESPALSAAVEGSGAADGMGDGTDVSRETPAADRPAGRPRTSITGPGRKSGARRGRLRIAVLCSVTAVAVLGVTSVVVTSLREGKGPGTAAHVQPSPPADTFSEGTLRAQVAALLAKAQRSEGRSPQSLGGGTGPHTNGPRVLKSGPTVPVPTCVQQGIGRTDAPLAAQEGTFQGKDTFLVVLPDASGASGRVTVYIVDAACVHRPAAKAGILLTRAYARS